MGRGGRTVLAIMAHPDDVEFTCAGTLALLKRTGWRVHVATMTPGDVGSMRLSRERIARVRRAEAAAAAAVLGAGYTCLEFEDLKIVYSVSAKRRVAGLIRRIRPDLVIVPAREDYMADHEETARIAREAVFASTIPNWETGGERPCRAMAAVLYADPIELIDWRGRRTATERIVDITGVIKVKEKMLAAHASQRAWLKSQHGEDEYLNSMKRWAASRAKDFRRAGVRYAEGFTRHLGHGFPKTDFLAAALGRRLVWTAAKG